MYASLQTDQGGKGTLESRMMVSVEQIFAYKAIYSRALPMVIERFTFVKGLYRLIANQHIHIEVLDEIDEEDRDGYLNSHVPRVPITS
jgi:hypothetical protein